MLRIFSFNLRQPFLLLTLMLILPSLLGAQQNSHISDGGKAVQSVVAAPPVVNFISDGCTMWFDADYRDCCVRHDADYAAGAADWHRRLRADNHLFLCVADKKGFWHKLIAPVMWSGVRVFGSDWLPVSSRNGVHRYAKRIFRFSGKPAKPTKPDGNRSPLISTLSLHYRGFYEQSKTRVFE